MKTILLALLEKTIAAIMSKDWDLLKTEVQHLLDKDIPGEEKHQIVLKNMYEFGSAFATWFLDIAIKMAYAKLANKPLMDANWK